MKRVSKYERMVGTEINGVLVSNYRRLEKVSKISGRKYYRYEVELNNVLWISTTSFNKGSYAKRLAKAMKDEEVINPTDDVFITEKQRKAWIKKYGYAWVNTPEGTFTAPEYEAMKAKEEAKRQEEVEAELRRYEQEQRDMVLDNIFEKVLPMCQGWFEEFTDINDFNNINVLGGIRWETPQELISRVSRVIKRIAKENKGNDFQEITLAVWYLFYQDKYEAWVHNNWDKLWNITRKQWEQWQNEHFGEGWKERWEWQNKCAFDIEATEFDVEFVGLTTVKEVKAIYRRLAKQYHSDLGGSDEKMIELNKAYQKALRNVSRNEVTLEQLLDELLAEVEAELKGAFLLA